MEPNLGIQQMSTPKRRHFFLCLHFTTDISYFISFLTALFLNLFLEKKGRGAKPTGFPKLFSYSHGCYARLSSPKSSADRKVDWP